MILLVVVLYILIAAICTFFMIVAACKYADCDFALPVLCGILWTIGAPFAAAYIAAKYYLKYIDNMDDE